MKKDLQDTGMFEAQMVVIQLDPYQNLCSSDGHSATLSHPQSLPQAPSSMLTNSAG